MWPEEINYNEFRTSTYRESLNYDEEHLYESVSTFTQHVAQTIIRVLFLPTVTSSTLIMQYLICNPFFLLFFEETIIFYELTA